MRRSLVSYARLALTVAVLLGPDAAARAAFTPGTVNARSMVFGDHARIYDVWVPAGYDGSAPVSLVVDLHGYGSSKTAQRFVSGMDDEANAHGFLVAYPQGLFGAADNPEASNLPDGPSWNGSDFCCGKAASEKIDDVGFLQAMVFAIADEANVDLRRVYATGLSNGGAMTHLLACRSASLFAAVAPMAFPLGLVPLDKCQPSRPIPVRHYAGLTDTLVPYGGGVLFPSAQESFDYWRDVTPCAGTTPDEVVVHGSSDCRSYTSCADGVEIGLCSILASAATQRPGHILYINDDLNLAADAWAFLSRFQSPPPVCGDGTGGAGEECDDGNLEPGDGCDAGCRLEPCTPAPQAACRGTLAKSSRLQLRDEADDALDRLQWKWNRGHATTLGEFGDPANGQELWLCLYAGGALRSATRIAAGGVCGDGPCWSGGSRGYELRDEAGGNGGLTRVSLREGEKGKARIRVSGEGAALALPGTISGDVVVQLKKTGGGVCWESSFRQPFLKNTATRFSAVGD